LDARHYSLLIMHLSQIICNIIVLFKNILEATVNDTIHLYNSILRAIRKVKQIWNVYHGNRQAAVMFPHIILS